MSTPSVHLQREGQDWIRGNDIAAERTTHEAIIAWEVVDAYGARA